ncbi:MAG: ATP-binding protein [Sandaracinus sp.]|nr:ATP-binding protein [Myxococcales bacterium]MAT29703.1 ATP-binding protein [Sandaracinus sp.]MBJ74478.1 ATP-binding protein [Sandaracinus sp.]
MDPWIASALGGGGGLLAGAALGWLLRRPGPERAPEGEAAEELLEETPVAFLVYGDEGDILFANRAAETLFFEGEAPLGQNFLTLVRQSPEPLRGALLGEATLFSLEDADGTPQTYQLSRTELEGRGEGEGPRTLLMVNHLTREVSRREVAILKKVIRVIGHELNNSLGSMGSLLGTARYIARNPEHLERLEEVLATVEERTEHLKKFLAGYADLAKLPRPRKREQGFGPLLERVARLHPEVRVEAAPEEEGWFDEAQLEQLLINLVKNALEAGSPAEEVEVRVVAREEGGWDVRVLDRGQGFGEEAIESALLPFYTTKPGGSGLGLALCREVAEGHGGSLGIRRRQGGGTAVTCSLPPKKVVKQSSRAALTLTRS